MPDVIVRKIDADLWQQFRARAAADGRQLRWVLAELIAYYVKHGLPKGR